MNIIEAVYEHGVFNPIGNPGLADGQSVKIILDSEKDEYAARVEKFRALFRLTQSLPELTNIAEEEIAAEIADHGESLECSNQQPQYTDFTQWIGYAKRLRENPHPRFRTDNDLWR